MEVTLNLQPQWTPSSSSLSPPPPPHPAPSPSPSPPLLLLLLSSPSNYSKVHQKWREERGEK